MAGWRKYFTPVPTSNNTNGSYSPFSNRLSGKPGPARSNYSSYLPDVYVGSPNRVERYGQYNTMDMDSEVNAALDILAEFCTQKNEQNDTPFIINFKNKATNSEITVIQKYLQQWATLQKFDTKMFRILRNTFKYGDQFFLRDPETKKWYHIDPANVTRIIVNESEGKIPEQYIVKNINFNFVDGIATTPFNTTGNSTTPGANYTTMGARGMVGQPFQSASGSRYMLDDQEMTIDAKHVVHLSLSEGLDQNYPFGNSLLEIIFKVYKQKELLEDAIIIYRVQRAPERRVFYIDVGNMPTHLAMSFVERVKTEIHQRRIPSQTGGGQSVIDSSYNPLCLDLETKIPLLDGRILTLTEIIEEFEQGKENWAYSCNPETGEVVPGVINWAGITRKNTEVIELELDNGKKLICTPDHKIPVFGKGFVEAQHITEQDSLISFNRKLEKISQNSNEYEQIWDHSKKEWVWTHRTVGEFFRKQEKHQEFTYLNEFIGQEKTVIHHKDYNRFNNDPRNLQYMNKKDHILYHAAQKNDYWKNLSEDERNKLSEKISNTLKENWINMSEQQRLTALYNIRSAQKKSVWLRKNDKQAAEKYKKNAGASRRAYIKNNPDFKKILMNNLSKNTKFSNQKINLTFEMLQILANIVKTQSKNKNKVIDLCNNNKQLLDLVKKENPTVTGKKNFHCKIDFSQFGYSKIDKLITKFGYKNWKHFVKEIDQFNHKIIKKTTLSSRDTGTITIDGREQWHNYHTFAVNCGIFIKNSIQEDYFFPQTSEGRGSKVDTLPGGTNLGEIDDLRYFTNKLVRGLRIPSSYLPTGADDANSQYNDGRVGTAYIQELRFNNYCERLQGLLIEAFDTEFKRYLLERGVNVDTSMFGLKFQPPQNFAAYRQSEIDNARVPTFSQMSAIPYMSKRFAMKRFLGFTDEEVAENEKLWREENEEAPQTADSAGEMRSAGISPVGIGADLGGMEDQLPLAGQPEQGQDLAGVQSATSRTPGQTPPPSAQTTI
jgi:hypothetical protein